MPDDRPSIVTEAEAHINAQGFPLEYSSARTLRQAGFEAHQGYYAQDPETGKSLEMDAIGVLRSADQRLTFELSVVVECKVIPRERCWVLLAPEENHETPGSVLRQIQGSRYGRAVAWLLHEDSHANRLPHYASRSLPLAFSGRTFQRGNGSQRRQGNDSHSSSDSSDTHSLFSTFNSLAKKVELFSNFVPQGSLAVTLTVPVIVCDGEVAIAQYADGALRLSPVDQVRIRWSGLPGKSRTQTTNMYLVRRDSFEAFLRTRIVPTFEGMRPLISPVWHDLRNALQDGKLTEAIRDGCAYAPHVDLFEEIRRLNEERPAYATVST